MSGGKPKSAKDRQQDYSVWLESKLRSAMGNQQGCGQEANYGHQWVINRIVVIKPA